MLFLAFSSLYFPYKSRISGHCNFASEMMIFFGIFNTLPSIACLTLSGIFLSAIYSFVLLTRLVYGPASLI